MLKRSLLIVIGSLCVVLGVIGIFLPVLPTTPFILLAAWCFSRSSQRFHQWLRSHRYLGQIVVAWENGEGIPAKIRNRVLLVMWISLLASTLLVAKVWAGLMFVIIGAGVSIYLLRLPEKVEQTLPQ